jgi:broad specificity phosphatase PhoE
LHHAPNFIFMSLIYLIRHARTHADPAIPAEQWLLSEEGFVAAAALAGKQFWTTIDRVLTSTEKKSHATIAAALELWELPHVAWAAFNEVQREGYTATQAEYEAQVRQLFAHPTQSVDGWEIADHALQRAMAGLNRALATYPGQNLAIVGHGLLWAIIRAHLLGKPEVDPAEWKAVRFPDVMVWRVEQGRWQMVQDFEGIRRDRG